MDVANVQPITKFDKQKSFGLFEYYDDEQDIYFSKPVKAKIPDSLQYKINDKIIDLPYVVGSDRNDDQSIIFKYGINTVGFIALKLTHNTVEASNIHTFAESKCMDITAKILTSINKDFTHDDLYYIAYPYYDNIRNQIHTYPEETRISLYIDIFNQIKCIRKEGYCYLNLRLENICKVGDRFIIGSFDNIYECDDSIEIVNSIFSYPHCKNDIVTANDENVVWGLYVLLMLIFTPTIKDFNSVHRLLKNGCNNRTTITNDMIYDKIQQIWGDSIFTNLCKKYIIDKKPTMTNVQILCTEIIKYQSEHKSIIEEVKHQDDVDGFVECKQTPIKHFNLNKIKQVTVDEKYIDSTNLPIIPKVILVDNSIVEYISTQNSIHKYGNESDGYFALKITQNKREIDIIKQHAQTLAECNLLGIKLLETNSKQLYFIAMIITDGSLHSIMKDVISYDYQSRIKLITMIMNYLKCLYKYKLCYVDVTSQNLFLLCDGKKLNVMFGGIDTIDNCNSNTNIPTYQYPYTKQPTAYEHMVWSMSILIMMIFCNDMKHVQMLEDTFNNYNEEKFTPICDTIWGKDTLLTSLFSGFISEKQEMSIDQLVKLVTSLPMDTNKTNISGCVIYKYNCGNPKGVAIINKLALIASKQENNFVDIYPWRKVNVYCKDNTINVYISMTSSNTICGWMTTKTDWDGNIYVHELTTIGGKKMTSIKGVGTSLIDEVFNTLPKGRYIYLDPLQTAIPFYERIGFVSDLSDGLMYKIK